MVLASPPIDAIVARIVQHVHPRRVVLFGSRARGDALAESDVDIMVEMDTEADPRRRVVEILSLFPRRDWSMDVKVYSVGRVEASRDDPGTLVYDILRHGKVLYRRPGAADVVPAARVREEGTPESFNWWVESAQADLLTIENNVAADRIPWDPVCFHAQQAAEKYLKALIVRRWRQPPRTHDLRKLVELCRQYGWRLGAIDGDCETLTSRAVDSRYPDDSFRPRRLATEADGRAAVAAMRGIIQCVTEALDAESPPS